MDEQPYTLILDDETTGLGDIALRLLRLGIDVFYANDPDEAVLFCSQEEAVTVRAVIFPETLDLAALGRVVPRLPVSSEGPGPSVVVMGDLADEDRIFELRKAGVDRVLRPPFDDGTLRWIANAARFENEHHPKRQHQRAPTSLLARASWGLKRKDLVCSTLSVGGAFLETPSPLEVGARIKLKLPLPGGDLTLKSVVANHTDGAGELRTCGMGVTFLGPSEEERERLAAYVAQRTHEFLL
ncbi:MAG: hypothetical protein CL910_00615 [Deltaproteobacteria bacterium]|jgi:hypothetical protein|nr:hypothetical protein [Deltaproteobacteria bacterium]